MTNLCEIEELCQYDRSCPFYAENCRKTERQEAGNGAPVAGQGPAKAPIQAGQVLARRGDQRLA